ncbi:MAG: hypothetical protein ACOC4M_10975 [Promethearchaeia archaeon]
MDPSIYKVIFSKKGQKLDQPANLRFKRLNLEKKLKIPSKLIYSLRELTGIHENFVYIQNIKRILNIKNGLPLKSYKQYLVLLFTSKKGEKKGFLLGGNKEGVFILLGIWPFNEIIEDTSSDIYYETLNHIQNNPHLYSKMCIIS